MTIKHVLRLTEHEFVKYFCEFCDKVSFSNAEKLGDHQAAIHKLSTLEEEEEQLQQQPVSFKCTDCQISFDTKAKVKYHRLKLHGKWQGGFR